jgi:hypothetical protein
VDVHLRHVVHQVVLPGSWVGVSDLWGGAELVVLDLLSRVNHLSGVLHTSPSASSDSEACVFLPDFLSGVFHLEA